MGVYCKHTDMFLWNDVRLPWTGTFPVLKELELGQSGESRQPLFCFLSVHRVCQATCLGPCYFKCPLGTGSLDITFDLLWNAEAQPHFPNDIYIFKRPPDSFAHGSLCSPHSGVCTTVITLEEGWVGPCDKQGAMGGWGQSGHALHA